MSVYERLQALGLSLPQVTPPVAAFVPFVRTGNLIFLSGHIAKKDGKPWAGKLGDGITTEQGREAARGIAVELLATLQAAMGDLNKIARILKLLVLVNSAPSFTEQLPSSVSSPTGPPSFSSKCSATVELTRAVPSVSPKSRSAPAWKSNSPPN